MNTQFCNHKLITMKQLFTLLLSLTSTFLFGQLTLTPNQTALDLANTLVASAGTAGVTISNPVLTCDTLANGFVSGSSLLGINNGIVLGTGRIASNGTDFGLDGHFSELTSTYLGAPGDATLSSLLTANTFDACVLEFDLVPVGNFVEFEYVFGSDEYPTFNCSAFNDVFGFFISGPGITGQANMALIPNTTIPVSINSINDGTGGNCSNFTNLYITNTDTNVTLNGFTTNLIATHPVTPAATYHLKLAVADVSDYILNTYTIIKANSLKSGSTAPSLITTLEDAGLQVYPTVANEKFTIRNLNNHAWDINLLSLDGKLALSKSISTLSEDIDISNLSKGIYILNFSNKEEGKFFSTKLIVE